jgi:hypothetical protein
MSDIDDLKNYYANLLIKQYHEQPKAKATIGALAEKMCCDLVFNEVRDAFDVETATGKQLDILGKYFGVNRYAVDNVGLGDNDMRFQIKLRMCKNYSNQSLKAIDDNLERFFPGWPFTFSDNKDMTLTYLFPTFLVSNLSFALKTDALPRPAGVAILYTVTPNPKDTFGYSLDGVADADVNGYGCNASGYEGGSFARTYNL